MKIKSRIDAIKLMASGQIKKGTTFYTNTGILEVVNVDVDNPIFLTLVDVFDPEDVRYWTLGDMVGKEFYK